MIKVVGQKDCARCASVKNALESWNQPYKYLNLEDLSPTEREKILAEAKEKKLLQLPILLDEDDVVISLSEVVPL